MKTSLSRHMAVALALLDPLSAAEPTEPADQDRPNILLIVSDDQGYGDFSCFGNQRLQTPNLDQLKSESVWLERFYVSPLCSPTRAALMTGRHQFRTGVWDTWGSRGNMAADETTLAEYLARSGYDTGHFGKWHLGTNYPFRPQDQGFATVVDTYYPLFQDRLKPRFAKNGTVGGPLDRFIDDAIADEAVKFLGRQRSRPFFAYVAFFMPHYYPGKQVPDEYVKPFEAYPEIPSGDREVYGMVSNLDENVGRLLAALRERGLADNTLVIFLSDNGPAFAAPVGPRAGSARFNYGLRGHKGLVYEGGIRVPAFVRWPRHTIPGSVTTPLSVEDVLPTVLGAAGIVADGATLDGRSFLPLVTRRGAPWSDRFIFQQQEPQRSGHLPQAFENACVIGERYKLVFPRTEAPPELYDLIADRGEAHDIAAANPTSVQKMKTAYEGWFSSVKSGRHFVPDRTIVGTEAQPEMEVSANYFDARYGFPIQVGPAGRYRVEVRSVREPQRRLALRDKRSGRVWPLALHAGADDRLGAEISWRAGERVDLEPVHLAAGPLGEQLEPIFPEIPLGLAALPFDTLRISRNLTP